MTTYTKHKVIHIMICITEKANADWSPDETNWGFSKFCAKVFGRSHKNPGAEKGM